MGMIPLPPRRRFHFNALWLLIILVFVVIGLFVAILILHFMILEVQSRPVGLATLGVLE